MKDQKRPDWDNPRKRVKFVQQIAIFKESLTSWLTTLYVCCCHDWIIDESLVRSKANFINNNYAVCF